LNYSLKAFSDTLDENPELHKTNYLLTLTHSIGNYRLVLKQGEPFTPVILRVHADPIALIGNILEQNPRACTKIQDMIELGVLMVKAGLTVRGSEESSTFADLEEQQIRIAKERVTSMCIDAALVEDDFETAYSYVMNRLIPIARPAQARAHSIEFRSPALTQEGSNPGAVFAVLPPATIDAWSWRAALQAGKYRRTEYTARPTHIGNASGNLELRHLQQRMDCLSVALRLAPPSTLQEILNVFRRLEEELGTKTQEEAEQEAAWDEQGDETAMPGGFGVQPSAKPSRAAATTSRGAEEAPMSIFDLTRASAARAQQSLHSITALGSREHRTTYDTNVGGTEGEPHEHGAEQDRVRKRDQLKNAAVGTVASGIGWLIGAPPVVSRQDDL
jgi:hypothetical protein